MHVCHGKEWGELKKREMNRESDNCTEEGEHNDVKLSLRVWDA